MKEMRAVAQSLLVSWRQRSLLPQTLIFFVTSRCNARCSFCLYGAQVASPTPANRELTITEIEEIARHYGPLNYLALSGGEPFIRKDISAICRAFATHCGVSVIDIPSNFSYTDTILEFLQDFLPAFPQVIVDLQLSLDHLGEKHDESRKVKGLFKRAIAGAERVSALRGKYPNLRIKANVVFLEENRGELGDIRREISRLVDFDRIQLTYPNRLLPGPSAEGERAELSGFLVEEKNSFAGSGVKGAKDLYALGMAATKPIYHRLLAGAVSGERNTGAYCEAGRHILVIDEKGEVFPCEPLWESIGNLREADFRVRDILNGERYEEFRRARLGPGKCNCTWGCAFTTEVSARKRYLPELAVNAGKAMLP